MRLRHIEVFNAIMLTGSTSAAAQLLNISQPSVSKTLQHAERSVGFSLFDRNKGKLIPTPEALALRQELLPFDEQLIRIRRLVISLARGTVAPLRVAATPALAHHLLPTAMASWCVAFPQSRCELSVAHTRELLHALLNNEIDVGLTMQPITHPNIIATPLRECRVYAIAPEDWWDETLLAEPLGAAELARQPLIAIDTDDYLGGILCEWLSHVPRPSKAQLSVQTYTLAKALVHARIGVALVDQFTANYPPACEGMQVRPLQLAVGMQVYALSAHARPPPKTAHRLLEILRTV